MAKVKRFGQGGSSSEPKRYIKRDANGARPASKPPVYQKEVAIRKSSEVSVPDRKEMSTKAKSTAIKPKVYEGELSGGELARRSKPAGNIGRDAIEGERVNKPLSTKGSSSVSSTGGKGVSSSSTSSSRAVSPKIYEGELSGSLPKNASGKASGNVYEGERVNKPLSTKSSSITEGSYRELPKSSTKSIEKGGPPSASTSKSQYGLKEASPRANAVTARAGNIGAVAKTAARTLSRGLGAASLALEPSELGDSSLSNEASTQAVKGGAFKQGSKSDSIVDAINAEPKKAPAPAPKKEAPVAVVKKQTTVVSKPKGPTEGDRARAALKEFRDWNASREPLDTSSAEDENAYTKTEATENMKKGGTTKRRPPKPAKKAPARRFASGGSTGRSSASKRGDGCATKGHTKGKYC